MKQQLFRQGRAFIAGASLFIFGNVINLEGQGAVLRLDQVWVEKKAVVSGDIAIQGEISLTHINQDSFNLDNITPEPSPTPVPIQRNVSQTKNPPIFTAPTDLESVFNTYAEAFGIDSNILKGIAKCESGMNPGSIGGPYGGMYQYLASTWMSTRKAMGLDPNPDLRFDAEEAIKTSAWKISAGGIGAWPHCSKIAQGHI